MDLPVLIHNRQRVQLVDGEYQLARGLQPAILDATLELIYPKHTSFTGILDNHSHELPCMGQIQINDEAARLIFVHPGDRIILQELCDLIEGLGIRAGAMGALFLQAAMDENSPLHYALCKCAYRPLYDLKFWRIDSQLIHQEAGSYQWQISSANDLIAIQSLIKSCIPAMVQPMWRMKPHHYPDYVLFDQQEIIGMASLHRHGDAAFIYPLLKMDCPQPEKALSALVHSIRAADPFLIIPSFQNLADNVQFQLKANTVLKQTMLVKYFVIHQKVLVEEEENQLVPERMRKPSAPISPSASREKY
jgi:hypothetical protein